MSSNLKYKQAANVERRTWDKETYEEKAKSRAQAEKSQQNNNSDTSYYSGQKRPLHDTSTGTGTGTSTTDQSASISNSLNEEEIKEEFTHAETGAAGPMNSKRAFLKARRNKLDLEGKVGTSEIINPEEATKSSIATDTGINIANGVSKAVSGVGWHCRVCDCFLKDSLTYLDHINGKKHQRALGFSMRVEKSSTKEVSNRLQALVKEKKFLEEKETVKVLNGGKEDEEVNEFEEIVKKKDEELLKRKADRARRREERRKKAQQEKKGFFLAPQEQEEGVSGVVEEGDDYDDDDGQTGGVHPDIAKMMGFSGFGGS